MYRNLADCSNSFFSGCNISISIMPIVLFVVLFLLLSTDVFAQWINKPTLNTELVGNASDPINILSLRDLNGGAFVFWQDNRHGFQNEVYYSRVGSNGVVQPINEPGFPSVQSSAYSDGKKVTELTGTEENPVCSNEISNSAIVIWNDFTYSKTGNLFAQRILGNGNRAWSDRGLQLTNSGDEISGYSVCSDKSGSSFVSYISKNPDITSPYKILVEKISSAGKFLFEQNSLLIYESRERKSMTTVVPDNEGGVYVFWVENQNGRSVILCQHVNKEGKAGWENESPVQRTKVLEISSSNHNVFSYVAKNAGDKSIYIAWQTQKSTKDIYHQLIDIKGRPLWGRGGRQVTTLKGNQFNPQAVCTDSTIILSWTNEVTNNSDVYIQKYNLGGRAQWAKSGVPVIKYKGGQFGQHLVSDGKGGAILSWIDRRDETALADIYAQRINTNGELVWESSGVPVATNHNTPKSYLSIIADDAGGAVVIFKNTRAGKNKIYGQKIFSTGEYISQIENLSTKLLGDSVKISWNAAGGQNRANYDVEIAVQSSDGNVSWRTLGTVSSSSNPASTSYEYFDKPTTSGTLFYRVTRTDLKGNSQRSDISRVNYFGKSTSIVVTQNTPNPFADSTIISFYLPASGMVEIDFFNDHVEKISELVKNFPSGESSITFYSKGLKPGIYFYRFKVDDFVDVKKMVITN